VDALTTLRSAGKPFQLAATLALLDPGQLAALTDRELALGAASHHGEPLHLEAIADLITKLGVSERALYCGAHAPLHKESADALLARGEPFSALHNNCAGKHAFMAAAVRARGLPPDYRPPEHPLQKAVAALLAEHSGGHIAGSVTDGCGVPCFVLPLSAMARAYASLAAAVQARDGSLLSTIGRAMQQHPVLVSGSEAFDGWLMQHARVIAKVGAAGLICIAVPELGLGIAIKAQSGSELVRPLATLAVLEAALPGFVGAPLPDRYRCVYNVVGAEVGALVTRLRPD
jgi:L-asparaginase II